MNAILREECEVSVLTNEAIEVHLSYLRPAIEAVQAGQLVLQQKIDQANRDRAAGDATLGEKIDQANRDRAAGDATLGEKIDTLAQQFMKLQASQDGLKWFISSLALLASGVSIAHSLQWI